MKLFILPLGISLFWIACTNDNLAVNTDAMTGFDSGVEQEGDAQTLFPSEEADAKVTSIQETDAYATEAGVLKANPSSSLCKTPCKNGKICTKANGGACASVLELQGKIGPEIYKTMLLSYMQCDDGEEDIDRLCSTYDTSAMGGDLFGHEIKDWICKTATSKDFGHKIILELIQKIHGCHLTDRHDNIEWQVDVIHPAPAGQYCLIHQRKDGFFGADKMVVKRCEDIYFEENQPKL